ncbi:NUDIX hydrolase [Dictyobacter arantiisoli]|uniref:NUDIX hydrolase n=1 Tax=Dictyobacter arantiisoli TaxID=2014874 RepID=UPI00155AC66A|nr:CoA pyrophosphatase [Dictyobacter arantiisoli]
MTNTVALLQRLRERLAPVEAAETLVDQVEGRQDNARKAAVLLPLFVDNGVLQLAFIRRASSLRAHSGEIAFPGGKVEATDTSVVMTALREAQEEIGLDPTLVEPLGLLSPVFTVVTNYLITPVVGFLPQGLGSLKLQESEVAELFQISLPALADPAIAYTEHWSRDGQTRIVHFFDYETYRIWGATGRILAAFLELCTQPDTPTQLETSAHCFPQ